MRSAALTRLSSVYIHWPYCKSICPYCDFNRYLERDVDEERLSACYQTELPNLMTNTLLPSPPSSPSLIEEDRLSFVPVTSVPSIYFGGGTPSLAPPSLFAQLIASASSLSTSQDIEVTMEANPTSVECAKLHAFHEAGVNRLSLGVQALNDRDLKYLGREHTSSNALEAIDLCRSLFNRVSFDLIYGRSVDHTVEQWQRELEQALSLGTSHLSLYSLTIEKGTAFHQRFSNQSLPDAIFLPDEDTAASMYEATVDLCQQAGLQQYEISNFAKPSQESRHNMGYWSGVDFIGIGPGAHSRITAVDGTRIAMSNERHPLKWMDAVERKGNGVATLTILSEREKIEELVMMGLRTSIGIHDSWFKLHSQGFSIFDYLSRDAVLLLSEDGFIEKGEEGIHCTRKGLAVLNSVIRELVTSMHMPG